MPIAVNETLTFQGSEQPTIGVEWELQLLEDRTLDLADKAMPLLELFPDCPWVKPELIQSCVEIASKVCSSIAELQTHLGEVLIQLQGQCRSLGLVLCGAGTHPLCRRLALITPVPRYLQQKALYGYLARNQITFATHVHLGVPSAEAAISLMGEFKPYLPILIAISASSPFWRGYETGFASYRQRILASGRSYGIPPDFTSWLEFCRFYEVSNKAGIFESFRDIHWDLRPRPHLGTLEVRVMDAQSNLQDVISLAAFILCLREYLQSVPPAARPPLLPKNLPWWLAKENYFQASRLGLLANYVDEEGEIHSLQEILKVLFAVLNSCARDLGLSDHVGVLQQKVSQGVSWQRQVAIYRNTGNLQSVAKGLVFELRQGLD